MPWPACSRQVPHWRRRQLSTGPASVTLGGRATDTDGVERNGAYGTSATTLAPFTGPKDGAKAQEYQNVDSAAIGVIDVRGGNRAYYFSPVRRGTSAATTSTS